MAKHGQKSNGLSFEPLENRVAPMVIKIADSLEKTVQGQVQSGDGDHKHAMMKFAKQLKKTIEKKPR